MIAFGPWRSLRPPSTSNGLALLKSEIDQYLRKLLECLPKGEGTFVVDIQGREILIKGNPKILKKAVPVWMRAVPGQRNIYDISTIKTKNDYFIEVTFRAFAIKALEHPEHARLFQESIRLFNAYS